MPHSINKMFKVSIVSSKQQSAYTELITPEKKCYICVEKEQDFKIAMFVEDEFSSNVYGCNLYLDGKIIKGKKTIKGKGCYHGFKQGGGVFKKFLFSIPPASEIEEEKKNLSYLQSQENEERERRGKDNKNFFKRKEYLGAEYFGTIHIEFFGTKEGEMKPARQPGGGMKQSFVQSGRNVDVKYAYQSMSIKEGEVFELPKGNFKRQKTSDSNSYGKENKGWAGKGGFKQHNKGFGGSNKSSWQSENDKNDDESNEPKMFQEYIILEREGAIDSITIHYADLPSLQMLGIVSLDNYYHLSMIPSSYLVDATYVIRVFKTILMSKKKIMLSDCSEEFEKATRCKLGDLFSNAEDELPEFFKLKDDIFNLNPDGSITLLHSCQEEPVISKPKKNLKAISNGNSASAVTKTELIVLD